MRDWRGPGSRLRGAGWPLHPQLPRLGARYALSLQQRLDAEGEWSVLCVAPAASFEPRRLHVECRPGHSWDGGCGASRPAGTRRTQRRFILPAPGFQGSRAPPHPIKRWHRFHALLPNGCFSRCAVLSAGWIQCFGGGTYREGRGFCLGTECPETWGSIVVPTSGFRDLLPSVGTLMELLQRERLRGLSAWVKRWMASAFWSGGMDCARALVVELGPGISS